MYDYVFHSYIFLNNFNHIKNNTDVKSKTLFLGTFAKLQKVNISFVMSVRMEQLGSHWTDF